MNAAIAFLKSNGLADDYEGIEKRGVPEPRRHPYNRGDVLSGGGDIASDSSARMGKHGGAIGDRTQAHLQKMPTISGAPPDSPIQFPINCVGREGSSRDPTGRQRLQLCVETD